MINDNPMSSMLQKPTDKDVKVMSSDEIAKYLEDLAREMGIDLSKADDEQTAKILSKISSLSDEIVNMRERKERNTNEKDLF